MIPKTLHIHAKSTDRNCITVGGVDSAGDAWGKLLIEHEGYVLGGFHIGGHGSDYIDFSVDIETGKIIGWDRDAVHARVVELAAQRGEEVDD